MEIGLSDKQLNNLYYYILVPVAFYISAGMCWLWLDKKESFDIGNSIFTIGMFALAIQRRFECPNQKIRCVYRLLIYVVPIVLGVMGVAVWYINQKI